MNGARSKCGFLILLTFSLAGPIAAQTVVDFEELTQFTGESPAGGGMFYNGNDGTGATNATGWKSRGVLFSNNYNGDSLPAFDFWNGWAYSNVVNSVSAGFTNQYASITGGGADESGGVAAGENYAIAYESGAYFDVPSDFELDTVDVTNSTYAALSMLNGDSFAKKFGGESGDDLDLFQLTFTGFDDVGATGIELGSVNVALADFRFDDSSQDFVLDQWQTVSLSSISEARSVSLSFESTDIGDFGINTPTYVAIDNINLSPVPEPSSIGLTLVGLVSMLAFRSRGLIGEFTSVIR